MSDSNSEEQGSKFLERDFNQCFQQMRHYDGQIIEIVKFALTAYSAIAAASLAFYKYGLDKGTDYRLPALALVIAGFLLGITLLALVTRNRTYFVLVTRYINEHRNFFLRTKPLGFPNATKMYTNARQPPYFNWRSSQTLLLNSLALLNSGLFALGVYFVADGFSDRWWLILGLASAVFLGQLAVSIRHLQTREGKSASHAVFGTD